MKELSQYIFEKLHPSKFNKDEQNLPTKYNIDELIDYLYREYIKSKNCISKINNTIEDFIPSDKYNEYFILGNSELHQFNEKLSEEILDNDDLIKQDILDGKTNWKINYTDGDDIDNYEYYLWVIESKDNKILHLRFWDFIDNQEQLFLIFRKDMFINLKNKEEA